MLANFLNKSSAVRPDAQQESNRRRSQLLLVIALPVWVLAGFGLAQALLVALITGLRSIGVPFETVNPSVLNAVIAAVIYVLSTVIVIGLPWWIKKYSTTKQELGLTRLPSWLDIGLAPAGAVVYLICSVALLAAVNAFIPGIDMNQVQETGFSNLSYRYEYILAFVTLIIVAPVFEEMLFRGYLYGKLRKVVSVWLAVIIVSILFAAIHGQWNVALDVFALSIVLCSLREMTGSIWAGVLLHMAKNSLAFYFLFVNPDFLRTIGG